MSGQLSMFEPTTSEATDSATSSPASVGGAVPYDSQGGLTTKQYGREAAHASHSQAQGNEAANKMSATYGRLGQGSSESRSLQLSLESRLTTQLPLDGLTTLSMTWRPKATPALRRYCQLVVSGRPTNDSGSGLLPTVSAQQQMGGIRMGGGSAASSGKRLRGGTHATEAWAKLLPTVTKRDERMDRWSPAYERRKSPSIDALSSKHGRAGMVDLAALAAWMMGYPREWLNQLWAGSVMPSSRKSRPSSSVHTEK